MEYTKPPTGHCGEIENPSKKLIENVCKTSARESINTKKIKNIDLIEDPMRRVYKVPVMLGYLVAELRKKDKKRQITSAIIQRMGYFLTKEKLTKFRYSVHLCGPISDTLSKELDFAAQENIISMEWVVDKGWNIKETKKLKKMVNLLTDEEKKKISSIANNFGKLSLNKLSEKVEYLMLSADNQNYKLKSENKTEENLI